MAIAKWVWKETAEVIGVLGIIAGIIFLGYEIRQNTTAVRSEASQGLQDQILGIYDMLMNDPMAEIYLKGMADPSALSAAEAVKFHSFWTVGLQAHQNMHTQVREGAIDQQLAEGWWQLLRDNFQSPGLQAHWEMRGNLLSAEFREFVETEVMPLKPTPQYEPFGVDSE